MAEPLGSVLWTMSAVLLTVAPVLPLYLVWRFAVLAYVSVASAILLHAGPSSLTPLLIVSVSPLVLLPYLAVRLAIAERWMTLEPDSLTGPKSGAKTVLDVVALTMVGAFVGLLATRRLAELLSGSDLGGNGDHLVAGSASAISLAVAALLRPLVAAIPAGALVTLSAVSDAGEGQPERIIASAEAFARGPPWCLVSGSTGDIVTDRSQLGFFSLTKGGGAPHLNLLVRDGGDVGLIGNWSIRQQKFFEPDRTIFKTYTCLPLQDFAAALHSGEVDGDLYAVGNGVYRVPPDYAPTVSHDGLTVRLPVEDDAEAWPHDLAKVGSATYSAMDGDASFRQPMPAGDSLSEVPDPPVFDLGDLPYRRVLLRDAGLPGQRDVTLDCNISGVSSDLCHVRVPEGSWTYEFWLRPSEIHDWREKARNWRAIFASLEVK